MIISRSPLRLSFIGGGSDLSAFYRRDVGAVLSAAINKYIYITVNKKFDRKIRASYSITEIVDHVDELKHELIREALRLVGLEGGVEITSISDVPSEGTGLGSSSSYTVGLLKALYAYAGRHVGADRLAHEACHIEIDICGKPIGKQDQYIAAYGGLQFLQFNADDSVFVDPVICSPATRHELQRMLLLFYTGVTRSANDLLADQRRNTESNGDTRLALQTMAAQARELRDALVINDLGAFGEILHQGWLAKKKMANGISNGRIDEWYERARRHGAIGGKIAGAGGGGFLLLCAPVDRHEGLRRALGELQPMEFRFEPQGSKIVFMEENG
ncbi:MAG TPA: hypothetical protein VNZ26_32410 [Vicinamibacterales bacterium]|nr:hypothetical protein [Vicinamibacterales bacterium]